MPPESGRTEIVLIEKSKKLEKKHIAIIATAALLALLIIAYTMLSLVLPLLQKPADGTDGPGIGASEYAYSIDADDVFSLMVKSDADSFSMIREEGEDGKLNSHYTFFYMDDEGEWNEYMPDIATAEDSFNYTDFYSTEELSGLSVPKITYLLAALAAPVIDQKIELKSDTRDAQLALYGLSADKSESILLEYKDKDGSKKSHKITVGDKLVDSIGYYYMVDDGDYVYASAASERFSYALGGFEKFLHSRIIAEGLTADSTYEPALTTNYKQWSSKFFDVLRDKNGDPILTPDGKEQPYSVTDGSEVIINMDILSPVYYSKDEDGKLYSEYEGYKNGFLSAGYSQTSIDLSHIKQMNETETSRLIAAIVGMEVNKEYNKTATVLNRSNLAMLQHEKDNETKGKYKYTITDIVSVLDATAECFDEGTSVGAHTLVKVKYDYYIDGEKQNADPCFAVIDLERAASIPQSALDGIKASSVGTLPSPIEYEVYYTSENTSKISREFVITKIDGIYNSSYVEVMGRDTVEEGDVIYFTYHERETDIYGNTFNTVSKKSAVDLSKIGADSGDVNQRIKAAIVGASKGEVDISVELLAFYYQPYHDFVQYEIKSVSGYAERELVSAFRFVNSSQRDPLTAESSYKNTLGEFDPDNPNRIYAIDDARCATVLNLLGGTGEGKDTQRSEGLLGDETVAVGLTPSVMKKYELYNGHSIYFELPREINYADEESDDFVWESTLGFYLYISPEKLNAETGEKYRYIGSSMYDIVVKIDAEDFEYLELSFTEYWARTSLAGINIDNIDSIDVKMNMKGLVGDYTFELKDKIVWIVTDENGNIQHLPYKPEEGLYANVEEYNEREVYASVNGFNGSAAVEGVYTETALSRLLSEGKRNYHKDFGSKNDPEYRLQLATVYNEVAGRPVVERNDTLGTACFKSTLLILYNTFYMGRVDKEEQSAALETLSPVLSITFDVDEASVVYEYEYEFYRLDDRRVMVAYSVVDLEGNKTETVSDFYLTDFAFKKILGSYVNLLSGVYVDPDSAYGE